MRVTIELENGKTQNIRVLEKISNDEFRLHYVIDGKILNKIDFKRQYCYCLEKTSFGSFEMCKRFGIKVKNNSNDYPKFIGKKPMKHFEWLVNLVLNMEIFLDLNFPNEKLPKNIINSYLLNFIGEEMKWDFNDFTNVYWGEDVELLGWCE